MNGSSFKQEPLLGFGFLSCPSDEHLPIGCGKNILKKKYLMELKLKNQ
jgi:hypothetical protein